LGAHAELLFRVPDNEARNYRNGGGIMSANHKAVSAETADAMHATITGLMRENERLRAALAALLQDDGAADDITAVRKQARAALKGAA